MLFQGSTSSPPADTAEVILRLQNGNDRASLRRIYSQDNGAILSLDGKRMLLQDLGGVKRRFSLEGEGFALIGQGEISQTIHQRPKERRRQLDALFGIERYRERRDESMNKLEDASNEAQRIGTLISELQARRQEISGDVEVAVQAQGIIDSLEVLRHDYYFFRRYNIEREQSDFELHRHIAMSRLETLEQWGRLWSLGLQHYEEKSSQDTSRDIYSSQIDAITSRKNDIQRRAFQLSTQVRDIRARRSTLLQELDTFRIQKEALSQERTRTKSEHDSLKHELEEKQKVFARQEQSFREAQAEAQSVIARRKKLLDDAAGLRQKHSRYEAEISVSISSRQAVLQELQELEAELSSRQKTLSRLTERKNSLEDDFTRLTTEYQRVAAQVQALRRELSHSESQYNHTYSSGTYPEPVRVILSASEKGMLRSKPKAAADVFSCSSQEIAEAVEAYLGGRQYWLLVRTMEEAQEGIDFLRQNKAGRATYLALERCRVREKDRRINITGGVIGWAIDLVNVMDEWHDAISHMMGDLLIVRDYATGSELVRAGVKFPIATVEGDIFAPSGAITGGALRQKSGAVTLRQKAEELRINIAELTGKLEDALSLEGSLRHDAEDTEGSLEDVRAELNAEQRSIKALTRNIEHLTNERDKAETNETKLKAELEDMAGKIAEFEGELAGLPDVSSENYDTLLSPMRNELRLLQERLNVTGALYKRVDGDYMTVSANTKKSEREIASGTEIEAENRKTLFELSQQKSEAHRDELAIRREIARHDEEFRGIRSRLERVRRKIARSGDNVSAMKQNISGLEAKISHLEAECSQLIDLWEDKYPYDMKEARDTEGGRELTSSLRKLERELKGLGTYNLGALSEDQALAERIDFLTEQLEDVNTSADELKALITDTDLQVEREFTASMSRIDTRFNELFVRLFGGGEARLTLQEGDSVWDRGVEIFARPPGKKLQSISQLSGGEQSLTSIALIFATLEAAGTPLAVLDEVDAALDEYNLVRFAELAREYSQSIQIIAMTHRRATMERADLIYGVTMIEPGLSATIGINPENYA